MTEHSETDLLSLIEQDCGQGRRSGRWWMFHCPFPGHANGDRNPSLSVTPDNNRWNCFGCHRHGDAIGWLMQFRGFSYPEAAAKLGKALHPKQHSSRPKAGVVGTIYDADAWQKRGLKFVAEAEAHLWGYSGQAALTYLHNRGLQDTTIRRYRLGLSPDERRDAMDAWGFAKGESKIWLPRGITIPYLIRDKLWGVNIRRPEGKPKYVKVKGSKHALFGARNLIGADFGLLCEGEFDCMIADQEIGDAIGVATMGSVSQKLDLSVWGPYLMRLRMILVAFDTDDAGDQGAKSLTELGNKLKRVHLPAGGWKDIDEFFIAGGDLWSWIREYIQIPSSWIDNSLFDFASGLGGVIKGVSD